MSVSDGAAPRPAWDPRGFRGVLDHLPVGVAWVDGHGRVIDCAVPFTQITGVDRGGALGSPWWPVGGAIPGPVPAGDRWFEPRVEALDDGTWGMCLVDVTDARRAEDALRVSADTLQALVRAAPVAVLALDLDRAVTLWNPAAERMFGWTAAEMLGQSYDRLIPASEREAFAGLFARVIGGEGFAGVEAPRLRRDGVHVPVSISTAPLRDAQGRTTGAMAIVADLTETRRLERQVREVERMEAVGRLAGGIAHDFNNLLAVIVSAAEVLQARLVGTQEVELAEDALRAATRAAELTRQLLAFSRQQVLRAEAVEVNETVGEVGAMLGRVLGERIRVDLDLAPDPLWVRADRGELVRVILNLAVNARDAMPEGGRLQLRTRRDPGPPVAVELTVADNGSGIPPDVLACIFEPFFTTKRPGEGTGLGLAMVHGFVHQSGGDVSVQSAPGQGTTFRIRLPEGAPPPVAAAPSAPAPVEQRAATVLVVEDDPDVRATVRCMVAALGHTTIEAAGLADALRVAEAHPGAIDLLLSDVVMPDASGPEVAAALRVGRPGLRVVFMSGYAADEVLRQGLATGEAPFLQKPFTARELAETVAECLARR